MIVYNLIERLELNSAIEFTDAQKSMAALNSPDEK
jgi:hypothetical protein